ncbi:MAG: M23 family metallopeptidase [Balneolaceae bacterium]
MKDFLKRLYVDRKKTVKVLLLDDSSPGNDKSYILKPKALFNFWIATSIILAIIVAFVFMLTPLGGLLYNSDEIEIRRELNNISMRVMALQDSLDIRDSQLGEIKKVIRTNADTTLTQDVRLREALEARNSNNPYISNPFQFTTVLDEINDSEFLIANILNNNTGFPSPYPVQGTFTRGYEPINGHYGIDIATKKDEVFTSVADGTVIASSWTIEYGYLLSVQHSDGIVTTFKHCSKLYKQEGESVQKGDILGLIGDVGVASSGPHLHFEIWKNGVPQNPLLYLIK